MHRRAYQRLSTASSWEELWEAGNYYERVAELLETATHSVVIVGWQIDSRLPMLRPGGGIETLKEKILRLVESKPELQFYILMWDHASFYVFEREAWQGRVWERIHPRVHFVFDNRHPLGASHHEKICLFDGRVALCGGIDLCDERWDSTSHLHTDPRRSLTLGKEHHGPYHDIGVQVSGSICRELHRHVAGRWQRISGIPFPSEPELESKEIDLFSQRHRIYLSRTRSHIDLEPKKRHVDREIQFLYRELISQAQNRIIIEGQYYWSKELNDLLIRKMHEMKGRAFELILILADLRYVHSPTHLMAQYELRLLERLEQAARFAGVKIRIGNPYSYPSNPASPSPTHINRKVMKSWGRARPVYVHSKTLIIDDRYLSIGSANFAARALRVDSEISLTLEARNELERRHIRDFSNELLDHWNIDKTIPGASVELRRLNPGLVLHSRRGLKRWLDPPAPDFTWIHWERFFDPAISWTYPLKRWIFARSRSESCVPFAFAIEKCALTGLATALTLLISGVSPSHTEAFLWSTYYAFFLVSVWVLPVPFLPIALYASAHLSHLDARTSVVLPIVTLWIASLWGYLATRMFPTAAGRLYLSSVEAGSQRSLERVREPFSERYFPRFLSATLDPSVPLHYKIAFEGVYCAPGPWFALVNGLLLPSILYGILYPWTRAWIAYAPGPVLQFQGLLAFPWTALMLGIGIQRMKKRSIQCKSD